MRFLSQFFSLPELVLDNSQFEAIEETDNDYSNYSDIISFAAASLQTTKAKSFGQGQLNELVRDLALSQEATKILAYLLSTHKVLDFKTKKTFYCHRDEVLKVYCCIMKYMYFEVYTAA